MAAPRYRIFFDTSVYLAALLSPRGASGQLVQLAEAGAVTMLVSERVVVESDQVLRRKFPDLIEESRLLWKGLAPEIAPAPTAAQLVPFRERLAPGDASILCSAHLAKVSLFTTWNTRDFMKPDVESLVSFPIVVPERALRNFRAWIQPFLE